MSSTEGSGATRAGEDLFHNEDAFLVEDGLGLYVVCDGVSGRPAGEIAAGVAVEALEEFVARSQEEFRDVLAEGLSPRFAERAVRAAIDAVLAASEVRAELRGMATTLTMLLARGGRGLVGHVGDSRAYLIRGRRLQRLTLDHELTGEPSSGPVSQGLPEDLRPLAVDTFAIELRPDDVFVLCTDGAIGALADPGFAREAADVSPRLLASRIASAAHRGGQGRDATVVVVRVRREHEPAWLHLSVEPRPVAFGHAVAVTASRTSDSGR